MNSRIAAVSTTLLSLLALQPAYAQYNDSAGKSAPREKVTVESKDHDGHVIHTEVEQKPKSDGWGNVEGSKYDLAVDGAFEGQTIAVIHLCTEFDFSLPKAALKEKGFSVYRWYAKPPSPSELEKALEKSSQLWIISST